MNCCGRIGKGVREIAWINRGGPCCDRLSRMTTITGEESNPVCYGRKRQPGVAALVAPCVKGVTPCGSLMEMGSKLAGECRKRNRAGLKLPGGVLKRVSGALKLMGDVFKGVGGALKLPVG